MKIFELCIMASIIGFTSSLCLAGEAPHDGAKQSQIVGKPLPNGIKTLTLTADCKTLLALTEDDLFVLDTITLSPSDTISIKVKDDGHDLSTYWSADNVVISPDQKFALVLDKYIDIATAKPKVTLDVASAVAKGNPNPKALDISPSGDLGLVMVYSFSAGKHNSLAVFDLKTGKLTHSRETGEDVANAVFVSETTLMLFRSDGEVTIEDINGQTSTPLTETAPIPRLGGNRISVSGAGKDRIIIATGSDKQGASCILAVRPATGDILFKDACDGSAFTQVDSEWVIYQTSRASKTLCACGGHPLTDMFLKAKSIKTGEVIEHKVHKMFDMMVFNSRQNSLLCVDHDTVTSKELPATFMKMINQDKIVEQENPPDKK